MSKKEEIINYFKAEKNLEEIIELGYNKKYAKGVLKDYLKIYENLEVENVKIREVQHSSHVLNSICEAEKF